MRKIVSVIMTAIQIFLLFSCVMTDNDIDNYYNDIKSYYAGSFMPDLKEIGDYSVVEYFSRKDECIFPEYSMQLIVRYHEGAYIKEKERLESAYRYLKEPQRLADSECYTIPVVEFSVSDYYFKIVDSADDSFPKSFGMVGISDEKHEIVYLWFYGPDLDYICEEYEDGNEQMLVFINTHFDLN